jgi:hydroxymethylpyrimidine pyrophosphatase-like HAD family hydrolase
MTYQALATDYDGTLAHDGRVDAATLAMLARARRHGVRLLLVTGRELEDLAATFPALDSLDLIVAENGALLLEPRTGDVEILAPPPPPALLEALRAARIPHSVGHAIVATVEPHGQAVHRIVEALGLPWQLIHNKGAVMALPAGVTKATGLAAALQRCGLAPATVVGVGDAENDLPMLQACGLGVAVANGLPAVKAAADMVTAGARGRGVVELLDRLLAGALPPPRRAPGLTGGSVASDA